MVFLSRLAFTSVDSQARIQMAIWESHNTGQPAASAHNGTGFWGSGVGSVSSSGTGTYRVTPGTRTTTGSLICTLGFVAEQLIRKSAANRAATVFIVPRNGFNDFTAHIRLTLSRLQRTLALT